MIVARIDVEIAKWILLFIGGCAFVSARQQDIVLDVSGDTYYGWKLSGPYVYFPSGETLHHEKNLLPNDFDFHAFDKKRGIWAGIPDIPEGYNSSKTHISFQYNLVAQLFHTIEITHCIRGDATLSLTVHGSPAYTIPAPKPPTYTFVTTQIPISPSAQFLVDGNVSQKDSFILIDRIRAIWFRENTTIRPDSTTTLQTTTPLIPSYANNTTFQFFNLLIMLTMSMIFW